MYIIILDSEGYKLVCRSKIQTTIEALNSFGTPVTFTAGIWMIYGIINAWDFHELLQTHSTDIYSKNFSMFPGLYSTTANKCDEFLQHAHVLLPHVLQHGHSMRSDMEVNAIFHRGEGQGGGGLARNITITYKECTNSKQANGNTTHIHSG